MFRYAWSAFSLAGSSSRYQPTAEPWSVASHASLGLPSQPTVSQPVNGRSVNHGPAGSSTRSAARYTSKHARICPVSAGPRPTCSISILIANPYRGRPRHLISSAASATWRTPRVTRGPPELVW